MKKTQGVTLLFLSVVMKKPEGVTLSYFIGRHEKRHKGNNRKTHIHFNVMHILFIDD
jgi:hypothetical protein